MSDYGEEGEAEDDDGFTGKYEGSRNERNERHGFGKAVLPNKDLYEGNYMNGKRDGYGLYKFLSKAAKGARYMGEYYQGRKQGFGVFVYPDGSRYEGNWVNDMKEGQGTYLYTNGDTYEGDWYQNNRHGNGTYTFKRDSLKYVGSWHKGKIHGYGSYVYPNFKYSGRFRSNKAFGHGKFVFDTACEMHGAYTLDSKQATYSDIEQEAALLAVERALVGGGEDEEISNLEDIVIPGTPPPIEGEPRWGYHSTTALHIMTDEEAEEQRLVEELKRLRARLELQLAEMLELETRKAEEKAARDARMEAERAALENMANELDQGEEAGEDGKETTAEGEGEGEAEGEVMAEGEGEGEGQGEGEVEEQGRGEGEEGTVDGDEDA